MKRDCVAVYTKLLFLHLTFKANIFAMEKALTVFQKYFEKISAFPFLKLLWRLVLRFFGFVRL